MAKNNIIPLSGLGNHEKGRVLSFSSDPEILSRLHSMGLAAGAVVEVLAGSESSNYLVSIGNTRIGIEPKLAKAVTVQKLS